MKPIWTTNRHGSGYATDKDGNTCRGSTTAAESYEEGHLRMALKLCQKMGWNGTLTGHYVLRDGKNVGMIWVWDNEFAPSFRVDQVAAHVE